MKKQDPWHIFLAVFILALHGLFSGCSRQDVRGSVFITTQGAENLRLGGTQVLVFEHDAFAAFKGQQEAIIASEAVKGTDTLVERVMSRVLNGLPPPLAEAHTDANGNFEITLSGGATVAIVAQAERRLPDGALERYYWCQWVDLARREQKEVILSNFDLVEAGGGDQVFILNKDTVQKARFAVALGSFDQAIEAGNANAAVAAFNAAGEQEPRAAELVGLDNRLKALVAQRLQVVTNKLDSGDVFAAQTLLKELEATFPQEPQLPSFRDKLRVGFANHYSKAFEDAVQSGNDVRAAAELRHVNEYSVDAGLIASFQTKLVALEDHRFTAIDAKLSGQDVAAAESLLADTASNFPENRRIAEYTIKLRRAKAAKEFDETLSRGDLATAVDQLSYLNELFTDEASRQAFQIKLSDLKSRRFQEIDKYLADNDPSGAAQACEHIAAIVPNDDRLASYRVRIVRARFDVSVRSFHRAVLSKEFDAASDQLSAARQLVPGDDSLDHLDRELREAKFDSDYQAVTALLASGDLVQAKAIFLNLNKLAVETDRAGVLGAKLNSDVSKAVGGIVARGREALRVSDEGGAVEALRSAKALDDQSSNTMALVRELDLFRYRRGLAEVRSRFEANAFAPALESIMAVLADHPSDPLALQIETLLEDLISLPPASEFKPEEMINLASSSGRQWYDRPDSIVFLARITSYENPDSRNAPPPMVYSEKINLLGTSYVVCIDLRDARDEFRGPRIEAPPIGSTVLVFARGFRVDMHPVGSVSRPVASAALPPQWGNALKKMGLSSVGLVGGVGAAPEPAIWTRAIKIVPSDFISAHKAALEAAVEKGQLVATSPAITTAH